MQCNGLANVPDNSFMNLSYYGGQIRVPQYLFYKAECVGVQPHSEPQLDVSALVLKCKHNVCVTDIIQMYIHNSRRQCNGLSNAPRSQLHDFHGLWR